MRKLILVGFLAAAACNAVPTGSGTTAKEPPAEKLDIGGSVDLNVLFRNALIGAPGGGSAVSWEITGSPPQAAYDAGLHLTPGGLLTLPDCTYATVYGFNFPLQINLMASSNGAVLLAVPITVDERFIAAAVACYVLSSETTCRDPAAGIVAEAGKTVQFYSRVRTSCRSIWSPDLPAGACPAGDASFTFCR